LDHSARGRSISSVEPIQHFYVSQRLRLSYWSWGAETAPPLILIHGRRAHARAWDRVAEAFSDRYYVMAPDLRGHGDSAWSTGSHYSPTEFALDIATLLGSLARPPAVIAHSFGAGVTLFTAGIFPELFDRLAAIETVNPRLAESGPEPGELRAWAVAAQAHEARQERIYPTIADAAQQLRGRNLRLGVEFAEHLARWGTRAVEGGFLWKFDPWLLTQNGLEVRADELPRYWGNITCPVLHISGGDSTINRSTYRGLPIEAYFRNARSTRIEGAGHWVQQERFDATVAVLREFLVGYAG